MSDPFWLTEAQTARLEPFFPSYSRKLVMALIGGLSWRCSRAAILSREKDMPHDEVSHHAVARSIGIFV